MWRPIDWVGLQIQQRFTPLWQLRIGVVMIIAAVVLHIMASTWFPTEPPGVLQLSIFALTLGGLNFITTARLSAVTEDTEADVDEHREAVE